MIIVEEIGHSVGKTWIMARIALWFLNAYRNSIVITTAPTNRQVEKLLWGELRDAFKRSKKPLPGRLMNTEVRISDKWYALGFSPQKSAVSVSDEQSASTFQGFHSDHILIIFDEATGIPEDVWKQVQGLLTSGLTVKFVCIANPTTRNSNFYKIMKSPTWKKIRLSCFDSPNLKSNGFNKLDDIIKEVDRLKEMDFDKRSLIMSSYKKPRPVLISAQFVIERAIEWGVKHPLFLSKVLGVFPEVDDNTMITEADFDLAVSRDYQIQEYDKRYIGVDVARFGSDYSVITEIVGNKVTKIIKLVKKDTSVITGEVTNLLLNSIYKNKDTSIAVDGTGVGGGVIDQLNQNKSDGIINPETNIYEIHFGGKSPEYSEDAKGGVSRYMNLKSYIFDNLKSEIINNLDLPDSAELRAELPTIRFDFDGKGRLKVESKDDYRKRTQGKSPDFSDSLAIAVYSKDLSKNTDMLAYKNYSGKKRNDNSFEKMYYGKNWKKYRGKI